MDKLRFYLVFIIGFIFYFYMDAHFFSLLQKEITTLTGSRAAGQIITYSITLIPLLMTVALLYGSYKNLPEKIGLSKHVSIGFGFAFIATLPMLIGYAIKFTLNRNLSVDTMIINTIVAGFFEEIIYRAFLFGMLYKLTRLGFIPSVFLGSLLFGMAHLYQSNDVQELFGIFLLTFLGSVLFAWIYAEWKFNLWTAILLHFFMNLYWLIFDVDAHALGGTYANIARFTTVLLAICTTIWYKKKTKTPFEVSGKTWWMKK